MKVTVRKGYTLFVGKQDGGHKKVVDASKKCVETEIEDMDLIKGQEYKLLPGTAPAPEERVMPQTSAIDSPGVADVSGGGRSIGRRKKATKKKTTRKKTTKKKSGKRSR